MIHNKRGISDVVTTVLIILLVLAAIVIVWSFIRPTLERTGESIDLQAKCFQVELRPTACDATADTATVQLVSAPNDVTVSSINVIVTDSTGTTHVASETAGDPGSTVTADYTLESPVYNVLVGDTATGAAVIEDDSGTAYSCPQTTVIVTCA